MNEPPPPRDREEGARAFGRRDGPIYIYRVPLLVDAAGVVASG